jgi:CRP-like cAMP-binding protein
MRDRSGEISSPRVHHVPVVVDPQLLVRAAHAADELPFMQMAGTGSRITASNLRQAFEKSRTLQNCCLLYAHAFAIQTMYTAMANGRSKLEERLARWILMARDRADTDELLLTHEFMSVMLGVRRSGVTVALHLLVKAGLIQAQRGIITIVDRDGLEEMSAGAYGVPEAESRRLFR